MSNEQESKISRIKDHQAKIENENNQIQKGILSFQNESKKNIDAFTEGLDQIRSKTRSSVADLLKNLDSVSKEFQDHGKKTLVSERDNLSERLDNLVGKVASGVEGLQNNMVDMTTKHAEEVSTIYHDMSDNISSGLSEIYSSQRTRITDFEKAIETKLVQLQRDLVSTVESEGTNQQEMTDNIVSSIENSMTDFRNTIRGLSDVKENEIDKLFSGTVTDSVSRLEMAKEDLLGAIDGTLNIVQENVATQKTTNETVIKTISGAINEEKSKVKQILTEIRTDSVNKWKTIENTQITALDSVKETAATEFEKALTVNEDFQREILTKLEHQFKASLYNEIDTIILSFSKYQDSLLGQIDALISRLTSARDEMKASLETLLVSSLKKVGVIGNQIEGNLTSSLSQISSSYKNSRENTLTNLTTAIDERIQGIESELTQYGQHISDQLEKTTTDFDVNTMSLFDTTHREVQETINKNASTLDGLETSIRESFTTLQEGQEENIETTLNGLRNSLRSKQSDLVTIIAGIDPAAEEHVEITLTKLADKRTEINQSSAAAFDDLRNQLKSLEQDAVSTIAGIVTDTHLKLDDSVETAENTTKDLVEGLESQHKQTIATYHSSMTKEMEISIQDMQTYRESLEDKFTEFYDAQQKPIDLFQESTRDRRNAIDEDRRSLEIKLEEYKDESTLGSEALTKGILNNAENVTNRVKQILKNVDDILRTL